MLFSKQIYAFGSVLYADLLQTLLEIWECFACRNCSDRKHETNFRKSCTQKECHSRSFFLFLVILTLPHKEEWYIISTVHRKICRESLLTLISNFYNKTIPFNYLLIWEHFLHCHHFRQHPLFLNFQVPNWAMLRYIYLFISGHTYKKVSYQSRNNSPLNRVRRRLDKVQNI